MSLSSNPARSIPLLFGLLAVVACTSKSDSLAKEYCEAIIDCESSQARCEKSADATHCEILRKWEKQECFVEFGYINEAAKHSGCSSELQSIYSCLLVESYCDDGDYEERIDLCAKEVADWETCETEHRSTHDSGAYYDSGAYSYYDSGSSYDSGSYE